VAAAILWSMAGVLTKFIPWSATSVACLRGLIAAMVQMAYSRTWKIKLTKPIILTAVCYLGETLLFTFANKMTSAGSAIVLQNTSPLYIMLMGLIDTFRGGELPGSNPMLGNLLALASGVFYAGIFFTSRLPGADSLQSTILGNLMYVFFIPLLFTDQAIMNPASTGVPAWQPWLAIFFMGSCQLGLSWICFSRGIKTTPSLQASFITMIEPVLNPILALILLGEAMGTLSVIGSALVIVTIVVHNVLTAKKAEKQAAEA
jgi:drug/metabolite transporter (DMT)-like permease